MVQKGVRHHLCEAPEGPFRQMVPDPFLNQGEAGIWRLHEARATAIPDRG
jgi:hypothetical protein